MMPPLLISILPPMSECPPEHGMASVGLAPAAKPRAAWDCDNVVLLPSVMMAPRRREAASTCPRRDRVAPSRRPVPALTSESHHGDWRVNRACVNLFKVCSEPKRRAAPTTVFPRLASLGRR